jgi:hypothetical protein
VERADPPNSIFLLEYSDTEFAMRRLGRAVGVQKSANLTCYVDDGERFEFAVRVFLQIGLQRCLPGGRGRLFSKAWRQDRARDDGQWLVLPFKDVPSSLQALWPPSNLHQAVHSEDQWKGRTLHSDGTARMGLRSRLPQLGSAIGRAAALATSLQLASATW